VVVSPSLKGLTYETFYGLHEKPFSLSTDPRFHYQSGAHERAGQALLAAIRTRGGPAVLTAPLGMGKTTLAVRCCRRLTPHGHIARAGTAAVIDDLLRTMLGDFGVVAREDLAGGARPTLAISECAQRALTRSLAQASAVVHRRSAARPGVRPWRADALCRVGSGETRVLQLVMVGQPR
jgi:type II secretory pathway predicted ATPase ExeA